jgi:hypothetical protein
MKKIIAYYAVLMLFVGVGLWFDRHRKTEVIDITFDEAEFNRKRLYIEKIWKKDHPQAKSPRFLYHVSYGKVDAVWINYY